MIRVTKGHKFVTIREDGYSEYYKAWMGGAKRWEVKVPIREFKREWVVLDPMQGLYPHDQHFYKSMGYKVKDLGVVQ